MSGKIYEVDDVALKVAVCRGDFWLKLEEAVKQCHGNPDIVLKKTLVNVICGVAGAERPSLAEWPLHKVVDLLAQNGIRMTFSPKWHVCPEIFMPEGSLTTTERTQ